MLPSFHNPELLQTALTHRSALNETRQGRLQSYERLEFLGDAVLELAVSEFLYAQFPKADEGALTSYRSALVKTDSLAKVAGQLKLGELVKISKGELRSGGRTNKNILADVFEALIGALYLDQGYRAVMSFLETVLLPNLADILRFHEYKDAKSLLQEKVQAKGLRTPQYRVTQTRGPDHSKHFTVQVTIGGKVIAHGEGASKQTAEQEAAQIALEDFTK